MQIDADDIVIGYTQILKRKWVNYTYARGTDLLGYTSSLGETVYYRTNVHGDVKELVNVFGESMERYDYNAYGAEGEDYNPFRRMFGKKSTHNPFRYTGEYTDSETGLVYLRNRMYDPETGRFITEDTHWSVENCIYGDNYKKTPNINAIEQSSNLYAYCGNNPINRYDLSGYNWFDDAWNSAYNVAIMVGSVIDESQKAAQRSVWALGAQKYLREQKDYQTSAWMLEHSLQDNPSDIWRGDDSRIAYLIKNDPAFSGALDNVLYDQKNNKDGYFLEYDISVTFATGDLYYSIHRSSFTIVGYKQEDGSWIIHATMHDTYDYTQIMTLMDNDGKYDKEISLGTVANDAAYISQKTGAINPYEVYVDFWVKR